MKTVLVATHSEDCESWYNMAVFDDKPSSIALILDWAMSVGFHCKSIIEYSDIPSVDSIEIYKDSIYGEYLSIRKLTVKV